MLTNTAQNLDWKFVKWWVWLESCICLGWLKWHLEQFQAQQLRGTETRVRPRSLKAKMASGNAAVLKHNTSEPKVTHEINVLEIQPQYLHVTSNFCHARATTEILHHLAAALQSIRRTVHIKKITLTFRTFFQNVCVAQLVPQIGRLLNKSGGFFQRGLGLYTRFQNAV